MTADAKRGVMMVKEGIKPLINVLNGGKISAIAEQHANAVLSALALNKDCHEELIATGGIPPMVRLLEATSVGTRKFTATASRGLRLRKRRRRLPRQVLSSRWSNGSCRQRRAPKDGETSPGSPKRRASKVGLPRRDSSGELDPSRLEQARSDTRSPSPEGRSPSPGLQKQPSASPMGEPSPKAVRRQSSMEDLPAVEDKPPIPPELKPVAALALADLARDNLELQAAISGAGAMKPLIIMTTSFKSRGAKAAAGALATLAAGNPENQITIAKEGGISPLIDLLKSGITRAHEHAARAISMLCNNENNRLDVAKTGGIEPLVALVGTGNDTAKFHAANALEKLTRDNPDNQQALHNFKAATPLVALLTSESDATAEAGVQALLGLVDHPSSQKIVIKKLVDTLSKPQITAQLKATEALAKLSSRSASHRAVILEKEAIEPLVKLLGNGQRADKLTPLERAAAVLADLIASPRPSRGLGLPAASALLHHALVNLRRSADACRNRDVPSVDNSRQQDLDDDDGRHRAIGQAAARRLRVRRGAAARRRSPVAARVVTGQQECDC